MLLADPGHGRRLPGNVPSGRARRPSEVPRRVAITVCMALTLNDNLLQELAQIIKSLDLSL
jgi:hypothetical protein